MSSYDDLLTRRQWLALGSVAAGAVAAGRSGTAAPAPKAPTAPVSIAKVASYDEERVSRQRARLIYMLVRYIPVPFSQPRLPLGKKGSHRSPLAVRRLERGRKNRYG